MKAGDIEQLQGSYVWPQTLRRPKLPPKLVYFDLNHWISLAKALARHRDGRRHEESLAACMRAVDEGSVVFPISDTIYFEISKIAQYRQRRDLREVIEKVSRYMVVTSRSVISTHESRRCWIASSDRILSRSTRWTTSTGGSPGPSGWWAVSKSNPLTGEM